MDAQGFVYITGRASDMYISGGSNIYPREIEEKILLHPAVREVAVLGVPDPQWGEVGWAVCVGDEVPDLLDWLSRRVGRYKMPRRVIWWDELPKSGYGKITKKMIREELQRRGEWPETP
jgi:fatty-acyl-CoA synthase